MSALIPIVQCCMLQSPDDVPLLQNVAGRGARDQFPDTQL